VSYEGVRIFAPQDAEAGGTWLGLSEAGLFVAITNRHDGHRVDEPRSRGFLVLDALSEPDAASAKQRVLAESPGLYNSFHLVVADRTQAHLVWGDTQVLRHRELGSKMFVITERSESAAPTERIEHLHARLQELDGPKAPTLDAWARLLGEHRDDAPLEGVCVHAPTLDYGTRSSSIVMLGDAATQIGFWHADGPPCTTAYADLSEAVRQAFAESSS
jgi:uncharacterized protein with NRDE domain